MRSYSLKRRFFKCGFSLIEMLLVMTILAVIAGLSVPSFKRSFVAIELKNQAQEMVYLMRYAQSRSVTKGTQVRLNLDLGSKKYFLTEAEQQEERSLNFQPVKGQMGKVHTLTSQIEIESSESSLDFYPDGTIEKAQMRLCLKQECFVISTKEQRGNIRFFSSIK